MSNQPPVLVASPGWGNPSGVHGELRVLLNATDTEIKDSIRKAIRKNKMPVVSGEIVYKQFRVEGNEQIVAFEVD